MTVKLWVYFTEFPRSNLQASESTMPPGTMHNALLSHNLLPQMALQALLFPLGFI